jgi:hypothetical protein
MLYQIIKKHMPTIDDEGGGEESGREEPTFLHYRDPEIAREVVMGANLLRGTVLWAWRIREVPEGEEVFE